MKIYDRPVETPVLTKDDLKVGSVQPSTVKVKSRPVETSERRKKQDRRKRQLRWHGKFDMRSGKDRRRRDADQPKVDLDV